MSKYNTIISEAKIKYLNTKNEKSEVYATINHDWIKGTITITDYRNNNSLLTFVSKTHQGILEDFWDDITMKAYNKKLKSIDKMIEKMKKDFKIR